MRSGMRAVESILASKICGELIRSCLGGGGCKWESERVSEKRGREANVMWCDVKVKEEKASNTHNKFCCCFSSADFSLLCWASSCAVTVPTTTTTTCVENMRVRGKMEIWCVRAAVDGCFGTFHISHIAFRRRRPLVRSMYTHILRDSMINIHSSCGGGWRATATHIQCGHGQMRCEMWALAAASL